MKERYYEYETTSVRIQGLALEAEPPTGDPPFFF